MSRGSYTTRQSELIIDFLKSNNALQLTAQIIADALKGKAGQTTVYRNLEKLADAGLILKYDIPGRKEAFYKYIEMQEKPETACRLLCTKCGKIILVDCRLFSQFNAHVNDEHQFKLESSKTVLYGTCGNCKG